MNEINFHNFEGPVGSHGQISDVWRATAYVTYLFPRQPESIIRIYAQIEDKESIAVYRTACSCSNTPFKIIERYSRAIAIL